MTTQFITEYLDKKIEKDENYIVCTFYDLRVKNNFTEEQVQQFLTLAKIKLENIGYRVFFTGAKFRYNNNINVVKENEYMIAIKEGEIEDETK